MPAATVAGLTVEQLETVLAHEIAHIRRHDYLVNLLQVLVETLLFYHPAVWWVSFCIRRERELCCDDEVVRFAGDPFCYARALTTLERLRSATPALAVGSAGGELSYRIRRLVGDAQPQPDRWPAILAAALALLGATACARWTRTPQATDAVTVEVTADEKGVINGARVLSGPPDMRARALRGALAMPLEGRRVAIFTFPKDEIRRVQMLRHELEDFRRQYKGKPAGSDPALEVRYDRNLRELAAAEWEAEQP